MGQVKDFLVEHLQPLASPYLFVGAGFSLRYGSFFSWPDLLAHFAEKTGRSFEYYRSAAGGDLPLAASKVAEAFHEVWFTSDEYKAQVEQWSGRVPNISSPLKIEISRLLDERLDKFEVAPERAAEWALLKSATIDGAITTNYDGLLLKAFPEYVQFIGQDGLLFSDTQGIAEVYAIHGATAEPDSLVLTAEDYEEYEKRNAYLAAKLMTIFVEHPVVFLGYSFNDPNVHAMLNSIVGGLQGSSVEKLRDRLIFVEWDPAAAPSIESTVFPISGHLLPVTRLTVPDWVDIFEALGERKHALPARTLRILKEQVYDIVLTRDPKERLVAYADIDSAEAKDISVVFGVGAKLAATGIVGLTREDIIRDVLDNPSGGLPAADILSMHISKIPAEYWYPVHKYLREAGHLDAKGNIIDPAALPARVVEIAARNAAAVTTRVRYRHRKSMAYLAEHHDWHWIFNNALDLPSYISEASDLRTYLIENTDKTLEGPWWKTQYSKGIVAYDYIRFGLGWE